MPYNDGLVLEGGPKGVQDLPRDQEGGVQEEEHRDNHHQFVVLDHLVSREN